MMRLRFLWTQALLDGAALALAIALGSLVNFGTPFPWLFEPQVVPFLAIMFGGLVVAEWVVSSLLAGSAPRPSYGRALAGSGHRPGYYLAGPRRHQGVLLEISHRLVDGVVHAGGGGA